MIFIVNPISGNSHKNQIVTRLQKSGYEVVFTEYAGHAEIIARNTNARKVIAVGGDGTVNEVARGIMGTDKILGIIPCGSGDGLALHLGLSHNLNRSIKIIEEGKTSPLDAGIINGKPFFSVCGTGFDALISEKFAKSGKRGLANYIEQAVRTWKDYNPDRYTIEIDGKSWETEAVLITVGNSNQWGNGAKVTPLADSTDGELDITVVDKFKNIEIPMLAYRLMSGTVNEDLHVHCYRGRHITIRRQDSGPAHVDGDWFEAGNILDIEVIPHAINVLVPDETTVSKRLTIFAE